MAALLRLVVLVLVIGVARAHHFRLVVLTILGLAGIWMLQNKSQVNDFRSRLISGVASASSAGSGQLGQQRSIAKRAIGDEQQERSDFDWDSILSNDLLSCTRSFLCQLSAMPEENLSEAEKKMLDDIRLSVNNNQGATKEIAVALKNGESLKNLKQCKKIYKRCPYSKTKMLLLLDLFGSNT